METLILAVIVGVAVGLIVGALGAGGGIISVPVLVYLLGQSPHAATAESLVIVIMAAVAALPGHARRGNVRWREGALFAVASIIGAFVGGRLSVLVPANYLLISFGCLLIAVATLMAFRAARLRTPRVCEKPKKARNVSLLAVGLAATATGTLTGFFGVGGGFAVVPVLTLVLGFSIIHATGTSLLVMIVAASAGLLSRVGTGLEVDWVMTVLFGAGSMVGSMLGAPIASRAKPWILTSVFACLLYAVALFTLTKTILEML